MHAGGRHYGIDGLRIAAFGLLIVYHVAMVFAPWAWVVKWPETYQALIAPLALLTPWRLPLLFVVSGFATRRIVGRPGFVRARSERLLIPLGFALIALLPPEMWVRAREAGYQGSLAHFWLVDGWSPAPADGRMAFPAWEHLWFVLYLWTYTMLLAAVAPRLPAMQREAERWRAGARLLWLPIVALAGARVVLMFLVPERHQIATDWEGHALYLPMFLFGVVLGGSPALWRAIGRSARRAWPVAAVAGAGVLLVEELYPGTRVPPHLVAAAEHAAQAAMAWAMVVALLALADRFAARDFPGRARLAAAVFPAYLVHHPVIVVATWLLIPLHPPAWAAFAVVLGVTVVACALAAEAARRIAWLGPLLGVPARRRADEWVARPAG